MKNIKLIITVMWSAIYIISANATIFGAQKLENGAYTIKTITSYFNPDTGKTDDGGTSNAELGDGMSRSVIAEDALIEIENGKIWLTARINLYSNLKNIRFAPRNEKSGGFSQVSATKMAERSGKNNADYRFLIPSEDCDIRVEMYVEPMGRDVCFYFKADTETAKAGNGDFVRTIKSAVQGKSKFTDISNHWAKQDIEKIVEKGIFSGTSGTTFSPDSSITRGMFVTALGKLSGEDVSKYGKGKFQDVNSGAYYANYIGWAVDKGIASGTSGSTFNPDGVLTCEQAAVIMVKYADYKKVALKTDGRDKSDGSSSWAKKEVSRACKGGLLTDKNTSGYKYSSPATRANAASIIMQYINNYEAE